MPYQCSRFTLLRGQSQPLVDYHHLFSPAVTKLSPGVEAWAAFRQLPLSDVEFRTIENNIAPYLQ
jgi:hypothetical protein